MAVALHDLGGKGGGCESESGADLFLDARIEVGARADCAAQFSHGNPLAHFDQTLAHAAEFVIHEGQLEPESHWLGMDAMATSHHGG